jgi:hypothetical protein
MNSNCLKYLHDTNFSQLTPTEKVEIKNLGRATPDLVTSQSSSTKKQTYVRNFNPAIYANVVEWLR